MNDDVAPRRTACTRAGVGGASTRYCFPATPLSADHFRFYEAARSNLKALAMSTPVTSPVDYWRVLQSIDALHDPFARMAAQHVRTTSRVEMYRAARAAVEGLARHGLDACGLAGAATALDACWAADPHHGHVVPVVRGAR